MIALGHVLKRHNAGYFTHLRDESNKVLEAVAEAIEIAEQCGVHVEIVHFKCSGADNWGKAAIALSMIEQAKARGLERRLRFVPLRLRLKSAEESVAAMGAGGRRCGDAGAACRAATPAKKFAPTFSAMGLTIGGKYRRGTA